MQLDPYVTMVTDHLVAAAALGDDRTQQVAAALAASATSAVRLATLSAVSAAADEINAALLDTPGAAGIAVSVQFENDAAAIRVTEVAGREEPTVLGQDTPDGDASARISLRLSEPLKADIDAAATRDAVSVNTWLVRAARTALQPPRPAPGGGRGGQHIRGWVTG